MPQLRPFWWINLISWTIALIFVSLLFLSFISFPALIRSQLARFWAARN